MKRKVLIGGAIAILTTCVLAATGVIPMPWWKGKSIELQYKDCKIVSVTYGMVGQSSTTQPEMNPDDGKPAYDGSYLIYEVVEGERPDPASLVITADNGQQINPNLLTIDGVVECPAGTKLPVDPATRQQRMDTLMYVLCNGVVINTFPAEFILVGSPTAMPDGKIRQAGKLKSKIMLVKVRAWDSNGPLKTAGPTDDPTWFAYCPDGAKITYVPPGN